MKLNYHDLLPEAKRQLRIALRDCEEADSCGDLDAALSHLARFLIEQGYPIQGGL